MTALAVLQRAPFIPAVVEERWDKALLEEAASLVGYRPKAVSENAELQARNLNEVMLARALQAVDIQPFTVPSVKLYKSRMVRQLESTGSCGFVKFMHTADHMKFDGQDALTLSAMGAAISTIVTGFGTAIYHCDPNGFLLWQKYPVAYAPMALLLTTWAILRVARHKKATEVRAEWSKYWVEHYRESIPLFAVQRMVSLKKELPDVTFSVEQLSYTKRDLETQYRPAPIFHDPFLLANFRGISCYIDVWDEPGFEGRRQA